MDLESCSMKIRLFFSYWLPVVLYAGMIVMFSSMSTPQAHFPSWLGGINDKVVHALEYAVLAILCYRAFLYGVGPRFANFAGFLGVAGAILFGITDEIHQYFVPLREADPWDLLSNAVGSMVGVTCWQEVLLRFRLV